MSSTCQYDHVYLTGAGHFLPGEPIDNQRIDDYIAPLGRSCQRIKQRILAANGISNRHYAIGPDGSTQYSVAEMAAEAVRNCFVGNGKPSADLLASASSGGDLHLPGLAGQIQAELGWHALDTASHHGVCASGMQALANAARALELSEHERAVVVASESPSRLFKSSRFAGRRVDFNAHFLRWMLSDGAGAWCLDRNPERPGLALKLRWVHHRSYSGDFPLCMQMGADPGGKESWLDYPDISTAEAAGALNLRQDIRLLPNLFDIGTHEYIALVSQGLIEPERVDHFLCHYSSEQFRGVVADCLERARLTIPQSRWYSNLATRGNTGAASIFIMLSDFLQQRRPAPGEQILLFVPESGRFSVAFALFEVVTIEANDRSGQRKISGIAPPHDPEQLPADSLPALARLIRNLAAIWHDYRARAWHTPLIRRILAGHFSRADYLDWMAQWIPQVRQGAYWMRAAVASLGPRYRHLAGLIEQHAGEEQDDYQILFADYRQAGGLITDIDRLERNPGGQALDAFLKRSATRADPVELLGAIYIIEGTGQRIIPALLPLLRRQLAEPDLRLRFLDYHGENDAEHLQRWLDAVESVLAVAEDPDAVADRIERCARRTAELYLMQMEDILEAA